MALALLLYVIAEVAAVWAVAATVGVLWTVVLLVAGAVLGGWLARREGAKALAAVMRAARAGAPTHREVTDGMLVAAGGLLILVPGFLSDLVGFFVLLPPGRALLRRSWLRRMQRRARHGLFSRRPGADGHGPGGDVVDGEVIDGEVVSEEYEPRPGVRVIDPRP